MNLKERNDSNRNFFNRVVDIDYDKKHLEFMEGKTKISTLLDNDVKKVLDLGAGTGLELIPIFEKFPDIEITVVDLTEKMLAVLKERFKDKDINIIRGDFFEVDLGGNYDAVISSAALHHFDEKDKLALFKKAYDALKKGGQFINNDHYAASQEEQDRLLDEYISNPNLRAHMDTPLTIDNEKRLLELAGFKDVNSLEEKNKKYQLVYARK